MYWKKDFIIKVDDDPNVPRSLTSVPDNFVAHIRTYKVIVTLEGMPVAITLRAKTDGNWYLDASRPTGDSNNHLTSLETSLKERLSELQAPKDARKAFSAAGRTTVLSKHSLLRVSKISCFDTSSSEVEETAIPQTTELCGEAHTLREGS